MASHGWGTRAPLVDWLFEEPYRFEFFQAVRLLEMLHPDRSSPGETPDLKKEAVRFRSSFGLAFPPGEVTDLSDREKPTLTVSFLGLGGAHGPLPLWVTERVLERVRDKDTALRDFLDIFNHRLVSLAYRIRRLHRLGIEWGSPDKHKFASYLYATIGLESGGLHGRLRIPDRSLLRYAGLLCRFPRSTSILCVILSDYFSTKVVDKQFIGMFRSFDEEQTTHIGETGQNQILGQSTMIGTQLWDQHAGILLEVGPLSFEKYLDFLPGQPGLTAFCQVARFYLGPNFDIQIRLVVQGEKISFSKLGHEGGPRLGHTSWLSLGRPLQGTHTVDIAHVQRFADGPDPGQAQPS